MVSMLVARYGCHIFHTKYDRVKEYVQQYSDWVPYEHRVIAKVASPPPSGLCHYMEIN